MADTDRDQMDAMERSTRILVASGLFLTAIGLAITGVVMDSASMAACGTVLAVIGAAVRRRVSIYD